jgi:hypothetical protein
VLPELCPSSFAEKFEHVVSTSRLNVPLLAICRPLPEYEPVIVWLPPAVELYVAEQLLLVEVGELRVQVAVGKLPPPDVEKLTVPVGADAPLPAVSVTVAVHEVLVP